MCKCSLDDICFHKSSRRCKECAKLYKKSYRENNIEKIKQQDVEYRQNNKDKLLDKQREYRKSIPEVILERARDYRDRTREDRRKTKREYEKKKRQYVQYKLKINISSSIRSLLLGAKNRLPVLKFLPYTMQDLKEHFEKQFEPWMTWDNYGTYHHKTWNDDDLTTWTWQIDHIIPHSTFKYQSMTDHAFRDCWALSNLRPLSAKQNNLDGVHRTRHDLI